MNIYNVEKLKKTCQDLFRKFKKKSLLFQKQTYTTYCTVNFTFFFFIIFTPTVKVILDCFLCRFVYTDFEPHSNTSEVVCGE